ncbi:MAG: phosphatase PAP2 family protein, partial [Flavobacteriales bacterium]|nr:phosphatase PAP2 family protein [Flavobacteriales bacterium]
MRQLILLCLCLSCFFIQAQQDSTKKKERFSKLLFADVSNAGKSMLYTFKRPLSWKKKEWITFGAVLGIATATSFLDESASDFFQRNQSDYLNPFAELGDFIGQPEHQGPFLLAFWSVGVSINNKWMRETSSMMAASMATSGLLTAFGKEAFGRARPNKGEGSNSFKLFAGKDYHSLPSAHTTLSISSAWVLARQVKPLALKIPLYAIPVVVGWSRIYDNAHWFSDVVVSSALAIASAEAVIQYYSTIKKKDESKACLI